MDISVHEPDSLTLIGVVDTYESLIWNEKYDRAGDFEIYIPFSADILSLIYPGNYLSIEKSEQSMVVEKIVINDDPEKGTYLTASGRSLESLLDRRIIDPRRVSPTPDTTWRITTISGNLQTGIRKLISENAISPSDSSRIIPLLTFQNSTDPAVTGISIDAIQFMGENLYDTVQALCEGTGLGFRIVISGSNLIFSLYAGADRSYSQSANSFVVFSHEFENLNTSSYVCAVDNVRTTAFVAGEGEGEERKRAATGDTSASGLNLRELFVDANNISSQVDNETVSDTVYIQMLQAEGEEKLLDYLPEESFDADIDDQVQYHYGKDYFIGDIVQIENKLGLQTRVRVTEFIISDDSNGLECHPTFTIV